jgi:large subunit ribosomal protein L6
MSRIGKKPIEVPEKVKVDIQDKNISVSGPLGTLKYQLPKSIAAKNSEGKLEFEIVDKEDRQANALMGTTRARIANLVNGVNSGFSKTLEINGLGYRAQVQGKKLNLELGFSHPVLLDIPMGLSVEADAKLNTLTIKGTDKVEIGDFAAQIRRLRPPEPYKGKGIKYQGEHIARKAGKAASSGGK